MTTRTRPLAHVILILSGCLRLLGQTDDNTTYPYLPFDHATINYDAAPGTDPVGLLEKRLQSGHAKLEFDPKFGYLPSVLKNLGVNIDSQVLVFSKTSFQSPRISPATPRALYFNDSVSVGTVQRGDVLEFVSLDRNQAIQFYSLDVRKNDKPSFLRRTTECLNCHLSTGTLNIPGLLIASSYTSADGTPAFRGAQDITDHRTPIENRWGGWYVTGNAGQTLTRGNAISIDPRHPTVLDQRDSNLASLEKKFDTSLYLAPTSDMVALMTYEHQTRMTDLLIRLGWETRLAAADNKMAQFQDRFKFLVEEVAAYMLFADEARIKYPITGISTFTKTFPERGPRDKKGRSVRDFDLKTRMFRYPMSYFIYSEAFDNLPAAAKDALYRRLYGILSGKATGARYAKLSAADRTAILEILRDTKPTLPAYYLASAGGGGK
ncbi:MAG: hypothetical protein EXQ56_13505 [Acidobacteria bacterium]|nr:hypothetical protein [Acidobacteriota bacterium]